MEKEKHSASSSSSPNHPTQNNFQLTTVPDSHPPLLREPKTPHSDQPPPNSPQVNLDPKP